MYYILRAKPNGSMCNITSKQILFWGFAETPTIYPVERFDGSADTLTD